MVKGYRPCISVLTNKWDSKDARKKAEEIGNNLMNIEFNLPIKLGLVPQKSGSILVKIEKIGDVNFE